MGVVGAVEAVDRTVEAGATRAMDMTVELLTRRRKSRMVAKEAKLAGKSRGGKSGGKTGKRQREGKGDAEPAAKKKAVTCFNCGELGHYKSKCTKPEQLRITNGAAEDP